MKTLLVLVPDRLSDIVRKGEFAPRYYNPGEVFDVVHVVSTVEDRPPLDALQHTVGRASLRFHALPFGVTRTERWLRWMPAALERWAADGVALARHLRPALVRCHGLDVNAYLAARIHDALAVPYVVSVHTAADEHPERRSPRQRFLRRLFERIQRRALRQAARVLPVYEAIVPQLRRLGAERIEVVYNVVNGSCLRAKTGYDLAGAPRIVTVGRHVPFKSPAPIVEALAGLPGATLTVVGDGPEHGAVRGLARRLGLEDRVRFEPAMPNDRLVASLADYDLFAAHSQYAEIPKAVLEPMLAGVPVVMNHRPGAPVPELQGGCVRLVEPTPAAYREALADLARNHAERAALGRRGRERARALWDPVRVEQRVAAIYEELLAAAS